MAWRVVLTDPMLRMLLLALLLAVLLPAGGDSRAIAGWVSNAAVFVLFLLNGMRIDRGEVLAGIANWRYLVPLVAWTFAAMALIGLGFARLSVGSLPPLIAVGFLYLGTLPSTVQSAASYTALGRGNVALSVVSAALLNLLGVVLTVPLFLALGGTGEGGVGGAAAVKILLILVLPFALGQLVQGWTKKFIVQHKPKIAWIDRIVIAIAVYVAFSGAVEQGIGSRVSAQDWALLLVLVGAMLTLAHGGAWLASGLLRLPREDRTAFLFSGAQKSAAVGAPLATVLFPPEAAGFVVVPLLLYHLFQLVAAAPLATRLAQPPR